MEFTVPAASSLDQALDVFNNTKRFMNDKGFYPVNKAVQHIEYTHDNKREVAEVNEFATITKERVIIIFECKNLFLICTRDRGVLRGDPILVGRDEIDKVIYFDSLPQAT
jgi:hypothetical protein